MGVERMANPEWDNHTGKPVLPSGFAEQMYIVVDSFKLDEYLKEKFPDVDISFAGDFEMSNDSSKVVNITNDMFEEWDQKHFDDLMAGRPAGWGGPQYLMQRLCQQGKLPAGNYLVKVCW